MNVMQFQFSFAAPQQELNVLTSQLQLQMNYSWMNYLWSLCVKSRSIIMFTLEINRTAYKLWNLLGEMVAWLKMEEIREPQF